MKMFDSDDMTLVVGDIHCGPGQNLKRATILGRTIRDLAPNRVVFIGDFPTFDALSGWDKDKRRKMENRRYQKDIDACRKFLDLMYDAAGNVHPDYILTEGNHEDRLWRYLDNDPTFAEAIDYREDMGLNAAGWKVVPYKEYWNHKGVSFTHVPINESGRPVSGDNACKRSLGICNNSVVFGHTHKLASCSVHRHGGPHLTQALNVGCYFEHTDEYAVGSVTSYWRGLVVIDHYGSGTFNWSPIRLGKLKQVYG